jgi:lipid-binding SYLF domain-containing protein
MEDFIAKGWEFAGGGGAAAGAAGKTAGGQAGEQVINDALYYTLTKNGLQAGGAVAGTMFWKDKELNCARRSPRHATVTLTETRCTACSLGFMRRRGWRSRCFR